MLSTAFIVWCQYIGPTLFLVLFNTVSDNSIKLQLRIQASRKHGGDHVGRCYRNPPGRGPPKICQG